MADERFESVSVAGGAVVLLDGRPVTCGKDRLAALAQYETLRVAGMPFPPIPWRTRDVSVG